MVRVTARGKEPCEEISLISLAKAIGCNENMKLEIFFSAKTHKPETLLRTVASERRTLQKCV